MTKLSVLTWNTDMSPSMYDRIRRKQKLLRRLERYDGAYDVLCFQELVSFAVGPVTFGIYEAFPRLFELLPFLTMIWDYLMIGEGLIWPAAVIDNQTDVIEAARRFGYAYSLRSPLPHRYINSGLVILSKFPIVSEQSFFPPHDAIHRPSTILAGIDVRGSRVHIGSSYFVPDLDAPKPSYIICNTVNALLGRDPHALRSTHLHMIRKLIAGRRTVLVGDFNIDRSHAEYESVLSSLELGDPCQKEIGTFGGLAQPRQIDYILISKDMRCARIAANHHEHISDHYPLHAELELTSS